MQTIGRIFNIQHFSVHDGPGIRTVVFVKGCPLKCKWCANPESQVCKSELAWTKSECLHCKSCFRLSDLNCHFEKSESVKNDDKDDELFWNEKAIINKEKVSEVKKTCPTQALHVIGEEKTVREVLEEVEKDDAFYSESGGGLTVSGGEPLMQADFLYELLKEAGNHRINRAIETTGFAKYEILKKVASELDYLLIDVKAMNDEIHQKNTGVSNKLILENLRHLRADFPNLPIKVRTPVIPNVNDSEKEIEAIFDFVKSLGLNTKYELLRYHKLGESKYKTLHRKYEMPNVSLSDEKFLKLSVIASQSVSGGEGI